MYEKLNINTVLLQGKQNLWTRYIFSLCNQMIDFCVLHKII